MEYTQGTLGRVFVARLHDSDPIYESILEVANREGIKSAAVWAVGGIRSGKVVTGPENPIGRVIPKVAEFDDARELVGFGTIFPTDGKPTLHMHAGIGKDGQAMVVCPRIAANVYLVLEVVIVELLGINAERLPNEEFDVHVLSIASKQ